MSDELVGLIRGLGALKPLDAARAAAILGRRVQKIKDNGRQTVFALVGGVDRPFGRVELRKSLSSGRSLLQVELAEPVPFDSIQPAFGAGLLVSPDPRDPRPKMCCAYPVPAGELRLIFSTEDKRLLSFVVDESPLPRNR